MYVSLRKRNVNVNFSKFFMRDIMNQAVKVVITRERINMDKGTQEI